MFTDFSQVNVVNDAIRTIFAWFDAISYGLLAILYKLFYAVATTEIFKADTISQIYSRIQLIIGVFMVFELTMSVIKGIINPDTFTDTKSGASSLLSRVAISLVMLAMLVPINIPSPSNEYEIQINNNGILFGTLYSLQNRVLANNTLGRLILGTDDTGINYTNMDDEMGAKLDSSSRMFASSILRTFFRLNTKEGSDPPESVCDSVDENLMTIYSKEDQDPAAIVHLVNNKCDTAGWFSDIWYVLSAGTSGRAYVFSYTPILSTIVATVLAIVLIIYIIEIAKRAIKLAVLRLIAPIPIIAYIDSKGGKDSSFNTWIKSLAETYASLFIRVAIMYFVMFIVQNLLTNGISITQTGGFSGYVIAPLTTVFIIIGLFLFAKDAPKFIRKALGIKDPEGGFLSDIGTVLGTGVAVAGAIGSYASSRRANYDADTANAKLNARQRKYDQFYARNRRAGMSAADAASQASLQADEWLDKYGDRYAQMFAHGAGNRAKNTLSGILGAGRGLIVGSAAASESKGNAVAKMMAARDAMHKSDAKVMAAGRNGSTLGSGLRSLGRETITGQNAYDALDVEIKKRQQIVKNKELAIKKEADINAIKKRIMDRVSSKALEKNNAMCEVDLLNKLHLNYSYEDGSGDPVILGGSYRHWQSVTSAALASGKTNFEYEFVDGAGTRRKVILKTDDIKDIDYEMKDTAQNSFYQQASTIAGYDGEVFDNVKQLRAAGVSDTEINVAFNGGGGFKDVYGRKERELAERRNEINKENEAINKILQGPEGQKAEHDSKFGRKS